MGQIWRPTKGVHIKSIKNNRYLFQFFHWKEVKQRSRMEDLGSSISIPSRVPLFNMELLVDYVKEANSFWSWRIG